MLTRSSIDRPWILYEAGVAKGKLDKPVFGLVVGIPFEKATRGPFAQFQNSGDDPESLTKLVLQLIKRNSDAEPREAAVRLQVDAFIRQVEKLAAPAQTTVATESTDVDVNAVAKLFEEVKVMFRDLPDRLQSQLADGIGRRSIRHRMHPERMFDLVRHVERQSGDPRVLWLAVVSQLRDEAPALHVLGMELYRAVRTEDPRKISAALDGFQYSISSLRETRILAASEAKLTFMLMDLLPRLATALFATRTAARTSSRKKETTSEQVPE